MVAARAFHFVMRRARSSSPPARNVRNTPGDLQEMGTMSRFGRSLVVAASEVLLVGMAAVVAATPGTGVTGNTLVKGTSPGGIVVSSPEKTDVAVLEIT